MDIIIDYPPNYEQIKKVFKLHKGIMFAYGNKIYNPDNGGVDKPLLEHEKIHLKQQGNNPKKWWDRYLTDNDFRLSQELEAYKRQYRVAKNFYKSRDNVFTLLKNIARDLSGDMYGNIIDFSNAMKLIKQ